MAARRSNEQMIKDLEAKLKKLKEQVNVEKELKLTKDSPGVTEAVAAIENAATQNSTTVGEVIKAIARIKRTGLKIENPIRKTKE